jgi:hypothetical protein
MFTVVVVLLCVVFKLGLDLASPKSKVARSFYNIRSESYKQTRGPTGSPGWLCPITSARATVASSRQMMS